MSNVVVRVYTNTKDSGIYIEKLENNDEVVSTFDVDTDFIDLTPCEVHVDASAELYEDGDFVSRGQLVGYKEKDGVVTVEFDWMPVDEESTAS